MGHQDAFGKSTRVRNPKADAVLKFMNNRTALVPAVGPALAYLSVPMSAPADLSYRSSYVQGHLPS
jgi:hypothetical protein